MQHRPLARYVKLRVAHAPGTPGTFPPPPQVSDPDMHHGTCVTHVPWCRPGSLTSGFRWSRWRGKRSRHSRHMHNPQFYVSGKRPIEYPSETHLKLKSLENSFVHNILFNCPIILKVCTEQDSITALLCTKFQNDRVSEYQVMRKRDFTIFGFKMSFGRMSYIAQLPLRIIFRKIYKISLELFTFC